MCMLCNNGFLKLSEQFILFIWCLFSWLHLNLWFFLFVENIFFSWNILLCLNMIEDDNLIGTLSEIEKYCETSPGIVSGAGVCVD